MDTSEVIGWTLKQQKTLKNYNNNFPDKMFCCLTNSPRNPKYSINYYVRPGKAASCHI